MIKQPYVVTVFSGAEVMGTLHGERMAEIQALKTTESAGKDKRISVLFISYDRDVVVNEFNYDHQKPIPPFDILITYYGDNGAEKRYQIQKVQLTGTDYKYHPKGEIITPDDVVNGEYFYGTYEEMMEIKYD